MGKPFKDYICNCKNKCSEKVSVQDRQKFHDMFYKDGNFETQNAIIGRSVKSLPVSDRRVQEGEGFKRQFSRQYFMPTSVGDIKVCKGIFLQTLSIDSAKVHRTLSKVSKGDLKDKRGKHVPHNKLPEERLLHVREHINSFPCYDSHYCRKDSPEKKFLKEGLNLSLMYRLYKEKILQQNLSSEIVSQSVYEKIFYKDFNLGLKPPHKDTCKTCDGYDVKLKYLESQPETAEKKRAIAEVKTEKELHHRRVELARDTMKKDKEMAKKGECTVLSFDLQKTFSLPKVPTGVVYYKRQLSCFNLGIHDLGTAKGTMNLWHEAVAGRGPDEIGSCLLKYMQNNPMKSKVILWSDSCGGQNRNIKLTSLLMRLVQDPTNNIREIIQKFAIPGHSYMPNDTDFSHIEKAMKYQSHVFHPDDFANVIKACRTKKAAFDVNFMSTEDFHSSENVTAMLTNRKKVDGQTVSWLKIRSLRVSEETPNIMEYKYTHNEDIEYSKVSFCKRLKGRPAQLHNIVLDLKFPNGKPITTAKKNDLLSMLCLIPPMYHGFYNNICSEENTIEEYGADEDVQRDSE